MNLLRLCRQKLSVLALLSIYVLSTEAKNGSFPALFAFGDSILDTGNNNFLLTFMKGNYWPHGRSMIIPTGRFGNGRVFSDIIAEGLGIKKKLPAYRKLFTLPSDLKTGVCFASGGGGVDPITSRLMRVLTPEDQLRDFRLYKMKLMAIAGPAKAKEIISNAVILISQGNNDLAITKFTRPYKFAFGGNIYLTKLTGYNKKFMKDIYDIGGRKFAVMGVIPVGCVPMVRMSVPLRWCNFRSNVVAQLYNGKLKTGTKTWGKELAFRGAKFVYVDIFSSLLNIIQHYRKYGFTEVKNGCCCMPTAIIPCVNPDKYVFWDFVHPSERAYKLIGKKLSKDIKKGLK